MLTKITLSFETQKDIDRVTEFLDNQEIVTVEYTVKQFTGSFDITITPYWDDQGYYLPNIMRELAKQL